MSRTTASRATGSAMTLLAARISRKLGIGGGVADGAPHGGGVVGEVPVEADVHDGRQGLVDEFLEPDGGFGVFHFDGDADLGPLCGEGVHEGAVAEVAAGGGGAGDGEAVGVAGLGEECFGLFGIVGIGLDVLVVAEAAWVRRSGSRVWCRSRRRWCSTCRRGRLNRAWPGGRARR